MSDDHKELNLPDQKALEKEIGEYLSGKYGDRIKIVATGMLPMPEEDGGADGVEPGSREFIHFDLRPKELIAYLDEYVIGQERAKAVLATKICTHFNRIRFAAQNRDMAAGRIGRTKNNILLIGPTGVGKTYLIKLIADKIGVPFVKGDATKFSETGYVGGDVEDLVRDLVREADDDIERARHGIIYVDEIDKIASGRNGNGLDVSRSGVQRALLKPMEETEIDLKVPHDMISQIEAVEHYRATGKKKKRLINTRNILFIMSGAFDGLNDIIRRRMRRQTMGFAGEVVSAKEEKSWLPDVKSQDLVRFGFESEFIGRLPVTATLNPLSVADIERILQSPNCSIILAKRQDFMAYGITLFFERQAYGLIAEKAAAENTGARGLVSVIEEILLPFETALPSTDITHLAVGEELVSHPQSALDRLLSDKKEKKRHQQRCEAAKEVEVAALIDFFREKKADELLGRGVGLSPVRLGLMAQMTVDAISDPAAVCGQVAECVNHLEVWQQAVYQEFSQKLILEESAVDYILALAELSLTRLDNVCEGIVNSFEYGLKLLEQKGHSEEIFLTADSLREPDKFINTLVEDIFRVG